MIKQTKRIYNLLRTEKKFSVSPLFLHIDKARTFDGNGNYNHDKRPVTVKTLTSNHIEQKMDFFSFSGFWNWSTCLVTWSTICECMM